MQSTNEELQSTNEELETTKEELQSINEELITVNSELQGKIDQLAGMQNDMKNLLDNTHIGTLFLDEELNIRRFTPEATTIYRLVPTDVGRPLCDIKSNFDGEALLIQAKTVLDTLLPFEQEIQTQDGTWYLVRIQPYRTLENVIEGIVLTFTDISKRVVAENDVRLARDLAESVVDTIEEPLLVMDEDLKVISANHSFYQFFQVDVADTVGRKIYDLGNNQWNIPALRELLEIILPRDEAVKDFLVEHDFPVIGIQKIQLNARRIVGKSSELSLILLTAKDVGDKINLKEKNV
jgi:two-component system CheB/CheR fusion protein